MRAIITQDCTEAIRLGIDVAQSVAQMFNTMNRSASVSGSASTEAEMQGLSVFLMYGVDIKMERDLEDIPIIKLSKGIVDRDLMAEPRGLVQEIACLHGQVPSRHREALLTAFDPDEEIPLDALIHEYGYYT